MRLVVVTNEPPFPANHGGRVDVWRRLRALHAQGVEIFLVFWCGDSPEEQPDAQALSQMRELATGLDIHIIRRSWRERLKRMLNLVRYPSHVSSRLIPPARRDALVAQLQGFKPDAIWVESVYGGVLARDLAARFKVPLFCRSHNIEHVYMRRQLAKARTLRDRIALSVNLPHLQRWETSMLSRADAFFDISPEDLAEWRAQGLTNGHLLAPLVDEAFTRALEPSGPPAHDVAYVGNLYSHNNVEGVSWFLQEVVPLLKRQRPDLRIVLAGAKPLPSIQAACREAGVTLVASPPDITPFLRGSRVLVNPIFTGSGVNIKAIEMLFTGARLVTTTQGLKGMPPEARQHFDVVDTAPAFAQAILAGLEQDEQREQVYQGRASARALFSSGRIRWLLEALAKHLHA